MGFPLAYWAGIGHSRFSRDRRRCRPVMVFFSRWKDGYWRHLNGDKWPSIVWRGAGFGRLWRRRPNWFCEVPLELNRPFFDGRRPFRYVGVLRAWAGPSACAYDSAIRWHFVIASASLKHNYLSFFVHVLSFLFSNSLLSVLLHGISCLLIRYPQKVDIL